MAIWKLLVLLAQRFLDKLSVGPDKNKRATSRVTGMADNIFVRHTRN